MTGPGLEGGREKAGDGPRRQAEGLEFALKEDRARAEETATFPGIASAAISRGDGDGTRRHECGPFVIAKQAFFHPLMGDPTNPRDTLFLFVFPLPSQQAD